MGRAVVRVRFQKKVAGVDVVIRSEAEPQDRDWHPNNVIDQIMSKTWRDAGMTPLESAEDHVFLRRVWLQIVGRIPSEQVARNFLEIDPNQQTV